MNYNYHQNGQNAQNTQNLYACQQPAPYYAAPAGYQQQPVPQQHWTQPTPQPQRWASQPPVPQFEVPRVTYLTEQVRGVWREMLTRYVCRLDTNIFMLYCRETTHTVMREIEQILLASPGCYVMACEETRIELERIAQREAGEKGELAQTGLSWYLRLKEKKLLVEEPAFQYRGGDCNGYADASILIRLMAGMLLRRPEEKPIAFIARDAKLNKDVLALNGLKALSKAGTQEGICVFHVSKYGKPVPFDPNFVSRSQGQGSFAPQGQNGFAPQSQGGFAPQGYVPGGFERRGA